MKKLRFSLFLLIIFVFTMFTIFMVEKTDMLGLTDMSLKLSFHEENGHMTLSWERLPYPCFYRVETCSHKTGILPEETGEHFVTSGITFQSSYEVPTTAIPMFYRVTAYGMFGKLEGLSETAENPNYKTPPAPVPVFHYTEEHPASLMPYLVWHVVPQAVCYEVEILSDYPEHEGGTKLSATKRLESTRQVYTNGWQADLRSYAGRKVVYWRVRAMGLHHEPIGEFSEAEPLVLDSKVPVPDAPLINNFDYMPDFQQPLYPAYAWIPMHGIDNYEVELMIQPPGTPGGVKPDPERIWYKESGDTFSCYDEYPRPYAGEYYWRVRAVDKHGNTIGHYSEAQEFIVRKQDPRVYAAVFGDSVVHGGGALSYAPCSLEYSFVSYLDFPALNLGCSGDTSKTTLERFDTDVMPFHPKNLIILTGTNSLRATNIDAEDIIGDLKKIRDKCLANDIRPIFITLMPLNPKNIKNAFGTDTDPDWHEKMSDVNEFIRSQPYFVDVEKYFYAEGKKEMDYHFSVDGIHPDLRGKMLMGEAVNARRDLLVE